MKRLGPLAALLALFVATCTDSQSPVAPPPPPVLPPPPPATLVLTFNSPSQNEGAVLLELRGPGLGSVSAPDSAFTLSSELVSDTVLRALVVGNVSNVEILQVKIGGGNFISAYHAMLIEVASQSGALRDSLQAHSITITGR